MLPLQPDTLRLFSAQTIVRRVEKDAVVGKAALPEDGPPPPCLHGG